MKLLLVDDSALVRAILREVIQSDGSGWEVVGEAANGKEAVRLNQDLQPDVVICDLDMPIMDGLTATKEMMKTRPVPILIFSNQIDASNGFQAVQNGAIDVMRKPDIELFNDEDFHTAFFAKIKAAASSNLVPKNLPGDALSSNNQNDFFGFEMVVLGASTGGPRALSALLKRIPADFPLGMVLVQHLETGFDESYVRWLNEQTALQVCLAKNGDIPQPGELLVAPTDKHLFFSGKQLLLDNGPKILNQRPSVDRLFISAAQVFEQRLIAVLLTGMGRDGSDGCAAIKSGGGYTIVQDEASCTVFGMPKAAIEQGAASIVCPLEDIPVELQRLAVADAE